MLRLKRTILTAAFSGLLLLSAASNAQASNLTIDVKHIRNDDGKLQVAVFDQEKAYTESIIDQAYAAYTLKINGRNAVVTLHDLPAGRYAVSLFHDENGNDDLDTGLIGNPNEGYGTSNARDKYDELSFAEASVKMGEEDKVIEMCYLVK